MLAPFPAIGAALSTRDFLYFSICLVGAKVEVTDVL